MATKGTSDGKRAKKAPANASADPVVHRSPDVPTREQKLELALKACLQLRKAVIDFTPDLPAARYVSLPVTAVKEFDAEWTRLKELPK